MPTIEGYKFIYVAENGRTMVFITTEPTKEKAKAYFKAKYGNAQILSWRPLGVDALRNEGIGGDESKVLPPQRMELANSGRANIHRSQRH